MADPYVYREQVNFYKPITLKGRTASAGHKSKIRGSNMLPAAVALFSPERVP